MNLNTFYKLGSVLMIDMKVISLLVVRKEKVVLMHVARK